MKTIKGIANKHIIMKKGLALIVGNVKYASPDLRLINAVNDAIGVSNKLRRLGFVVNNYNDVTTEDFSRILHEFGDELQSYKVGAFYYAGHGLQIDGRNFLTGVDTSFHDSHSVQYSSINVDEIVDRMQHNSLDVKIIVLDACRDNPLPKMRGVTNDGLAPIHAPKGTIIAFSTSPGERAKDLGAGKHSVYTEAFLEHIGDVNIPIEEFFKRVRTTVFAHTKGKQTSWEHTSLIGEFFFNSGQLIHSVKLPYKTDHVADGLFSSSGSDFDEIIAKMKSYDWYQQGPALTKFRGIEPNNLTISESFFWAGRNFLQMAVGEERSSLQNHERVLILLMRFYQIIFREMMRTIFLMDYFLKYILVRRVGLGRTISKISSWIKFSTFKRTGGIRNHLTSFQVSSTRLGPLYFICQRACPRPFRLKLKSRTIRMMI